MLAGCSQALKDAGQGRVWFSCWSLKVIHRGLLTVAFFSQLVCHHYRKKPVNVDLFMKELHAILWNVEAIILLLLQVFYTSNAKHKFYEGSHMGCKPHAACICCFFVSKLTIWRTKIKQLHKKTTFRGSGGQAISVFLEVKITRFCP